MTSLNRRLFVEMLREEWRLHSELFGGSRFAGFPVFVALLTSGAVYLLTTTGTEIGAILAGVHGLALFFGLRTGSTGFVGQDAMRDVLGDATMLVFSARTLPVSQRRLLSVFLLKDAVYYAVLFLLPIAVGFTPAVASGDLTGVRDRSLEGVGVPNERGILPENLGDARAHPVDVTVDVVGGADEHEFLRTADRERWHHDRAALPDGRPDALDELTLDGVPRFVFDVAVGRLTEDDVGVGTGCRPGDESLAIGVKVTGIEQARFPIINENVRTPGDVAGVVERDLVSSRLERLTVAVGHRDLAHAIQVFLGERTLHRPAVEFERVPGERSREVPGRRCPVNLGAVAAGEECGNRAGVVEVAV